MYTISKLIHDTFYINLLTIDPDDPCKKRDPGWTTDDEIIIDDDLLDNDDLMKSNWLADYLQRTSNYLNKSGNH